MQVNKDTQSSDWVVSKNIQGLNTGGLETRGQCGRRYWSTMGGAIKQHEV